MASIIILYSLNVTVVLVCVVVRVRNIFKVFCFYVLLRPVFVCINAHSVIFEKLTFRFVLHYLQY